MHTRGRRAGQDRGSNGYLQDLHALDVGLKGQSTKTVRTPRPPALISWHLHADSFAFIGVEM